MKKQSLNIGPYADDAVMALKNILTNKPTPAPDPDNKDKNNMLLTDKTADEHFNSLAHLFDKTEHESFAPKKKAKPTVDLNWRKKMTAMHKSVEDVPSKAWESPKPAPSFHKEVLHSLKTNAKASIPDSVKGFFPKAMNHLSKHKLPYGLGAIGAGAVGTKLIFDHLNKEDSSTPAN